MTSKIFIILFLFFINLDRAIASCEVDSRAAFSDCSHNKIDEPLKLLAQIQQFQKDNPSATIPMLETSTATGEVARRKLQDFEKKCYDSFTKCIQTCEAEQQYQVARQCASEPQKNYEAAKQGGMDLSKILPLLTALLGQLKGSDSGSSDPCEKNVALCKTDTAAQSPGATLSNNTTRQATGETFEQGLNPDDTPGMGEAAAPSMAQGTPGASGGSGINTAGMGGGSSRGGKGVAEINGDGTPKINLASAPAGGGKNGGSITPGNSPSTTKGSGNPMASRVSMDGDGRSGTTAALVDKAMQSRGMASGEGQLGGVTAAHAFDNFKKIEQRIQVERNGLGEL